MQNLWQEQAEGGHHASKSSSNNMTELLVTNDDGILAPGLQALADSLKEFGRVRVIAPDRERSAVSHTFTMHTPIRITRLDENRIATTGTPTDCVMFGMLGFLENRPGLVVSGINPGPNMGLDVFYSGTVAAAHQAALLKVGGIAVSLDVQRDPDDPIKWHYETAVKAVQSLVPPALKYGMPEDVFFNVNVPNRPLDKVTGLEWTVLGHRIYRDTVIHRLDPNGRDYYWIGGAEPTWESLPGTDFFAVEQNRVSVTPMQWRVGSPELTARFSEWTVSFP